MRTYTPTCRPVDVTLPDGQTYRYLSKKDFRVIERAVRNEAELGAAVIGREWKIAAYFGKTLL
jgi:hypothetical protein